MNVTCNKCGRVHFGVTREDAQAEVDRFNRYFDTLTPENQEMFGRRSSIDSYERCIACGNPYTNFRPSQPGDCPDGCTINPVIV